MEALTIMNSEMIFKWSNVISMNEVEAVDGVTQQ